MRTWPPVIQLSAWLHERRIAPLREASMPAHLHACRHGSPAPAISLPHHLQTALASSPMHDEWLSKISPPLAYRIPLYVHIMTAAKLLFQALSPAHESCFCHPYKITQQLLHGLVTSSFPLAFSRFVHPISLPTTLATLQLASYVLLHPSMPLETPASLIFSAGFPSPCISATGLHPFQHLEPRTRQFSSLAH